MVIPQGGRAPFTFYLYPGPKVNTSGNFSGLSQGNYTLQIKDSAGCRYDTTVSIAAPQNPLAVSISKQDLACTGTGFEGWAQAIVNGGTAPYQYYWNTTPPQYDSHIEQLYFGWYQVDVQDANGCKIKDTVYIEPGNCCEAIFIPNAFSPNQDGTNDIFKLTTTAGLKLLQFEIYNRWGNKVWRTTDFREGWNGYEQGKPAATDTYFYILRYYCLTDGHLYTRKGDLMLIR
jgi:gliding motility-associated-like protein